MIGLPAPLAVVCHDAGAANLILAWLAAEPRGDVRAVMQGPAEQLWRARFGDAPFAGLEAALDGAAALLSGTGWGSDLEHRARRLARDSGISSVAVIDHWVNYRQRFVRAGAEVLPDFLWVTDEHALALAGREFPGLPVELRPNRYLEEQVARVNAMGGPGGEILYVLEPTRDDWGRGIPGEFQALDFFMEHRSRLGVGPYATIVLRPHPADPPGKYDEWAGGQDTRVRIDLGGDLAAAIARASTVAGCQSYALVVALAAGRPAVSTLPPWAPPCPLPQAGIIHLKLLTSPDS